MNNRTLATLALIDADRSNSCQALLMATECEMPKIAQRAALALASEPLYPVAVRQFGRCLVRSIRARMQGAIGRANHFEMVADRYYSQIPGGLQW
jgi:hypothetical protein